VETLVDAQRQRLIINEESYRIADGLPIIFGRGAFQNYHEVLSQLSGSQSFQDLDVSTLAATLRGHEITEHLRLAVDDWFSLSYAYDEQPIRQWLANLANELDSGSEKANRQSIRQAILTNDENAMVQIANKFIESPITDAEPFYTGLMISDGLFENLRLQQAMDVLRHLRSASQNKALPIPVFAVRWANHVLGLLLLQVGSQDQLYEAMQCAEAVSAIDPSYENVYIAKAGVYFALAKPEKALESLEKVQSPEHRIQKLQMQGLVTASVGRTEEARVISQQLLSQFPDSIFALVVAAETFNVLFDFEAARDAYQRALELDPTNPQLISNIYDRTAPEFQSNMAKVPAVRLRRFWGAKTNELYSDLRQAKQVDDFEAMLRARSQLRIFGVQDWRIDYEEFLSLLGGAEVDMDWEPVFQRSRNAVPGRIAESIPNSVLAAFANQPASLDSETTRGVVLRDIEITGTVYPASKYHRLRSAANLFRFVDRKMAIQFYKGAIRTISSLRELGFGNDAHWKREEVFLTNSIDTLEHPELIEHADPKGKALRMRAFKNVGTSQHSAKDFKTAEKTFSEMLKFAKSLADENPDSLAHQCDVALAIGWLASTKNSLGESDAGLALSDQDIALSESLLQKYPDARESQMNLVRAYQFRMEVLNRPDQLDQKLQATMKALDVLESVLKKSPNDGYVKLRMILNYSEAGQIHYDKSEWEAAKGFYEKALPMAEKRMSAEPNSSMAVSDVILIKNQLGAIALRLMHVVEAADHFSEASRIARTYVASHREDPKFLRLLAESLNWSSIASRTQSQPEEALEFLKQEIEIRKKIRDFGDADESGLLLAIGFRVNAFKKLGRFDEALLELNDSIRQMDKHPDLFHWRGQINYEKSEIQPAIDDYTRAIELNGNNAQYFRSRAEVYSWSEKYDLAEKDYARAIELEPKGEQNWLVRAQFLLHRERRQEALQDFDRWLELSPKDVDWLNIAGVIYFQQGNTLRAKEFLQKSIQVNPKDGVAYRNLGKIYAIERNWEQASQHYEKSMLHNGPFPQTWNEALLVAIKHEGTHREDIFEDMVFRFENDPSPDNTKAVVWAGTRFPWSRFTEKKLQEWNATWPTANNEDPLDSRMRGALALRFGDSILAESELRRWLEIEANKQDSSAQLLLVIALTKQSRLDDAIALLATTKETIDANAKQENELNPKPSAWLDQIETSILLEEAEKILKE
jgi:tetratricopeptide (TPR) repeat protein